MGTVQRLRLLGAALAFLVAGIHVLHPQLGFPRLVRHITIGTLFDPRPLAFTLSGVAIVVGVLLVYNRVAKRPIYLLGMGLMVTYIVGYVAWHTVLGHGAFWPHQPAIYYEDMGFLEIVLGHLVAEPIAAASKLLELSLLVVLAALYRLDRD